MENNFSTYGYVEYNPIKKHNRYYAVLYYYPNGVNNERHIISHIKVTEDLEQITKATFKLLGLKIVPDAVDDRIKNIYKIMKKRK